jgi:hypothetical protein
MRVLVRNVRTGKYFKAPENWVDKAEEAHDFKGTYQAIESKVWGKDEAVEIVFSFGEKRYDVSILVSAVESSSLSPRLYSGRNGRRDARPRRAGKTSQPGVDSKQSGGIGK